MKSFLKNNRGYTLIEMLISIIIAALLVAMVVGAVITFFVKFSELSYYATLQRDAFNTINSMKYGEPVGPNNAKEFFGLAAADSVTFAGESNGKFTSVTCHLSSTSSIHANDYINFFWDSSERCIKYSYMIGYDHPSNPIRLIPDEHRDKIDVTKLHFINVLGNKRIVKIELEAEITISDNQKKKINYETQVVIPRLN